MKVWELRRASGSLDVGLTKAPKLMGVIVRAETDEEARALASLQSRDGLGHVWLNDKLSTCIELEPLTDGKAGVVLAQWIGSEPAQSTQGTN